MAEDITPGLLKSIKATFRELYDSSPTVADLLKKVKAGTATYAQAQEYAIEVSRLIGLSWEKYISSATLPDGRMYYNIASGLIPSVLDDNHDLVADYAAKVQQQLNQQSRIGIRAQVAPINRDRENGLVAHVSNAERYDDVSGQLRTAMENFSQAVVDSTLRENVDFQGRAGLTPRVIRRAERGACKWCRALVGTYDYPDVPEDVYRRHENCRCLVEYDPGTGKRQDVHTKKWTDAEERDKINKRKSNGLLADSRRRYEPDVYIPKGVGAKQKNILVRLPNGQRVVLTPGSRITKVQTIAGLGRNRKIDMVDILTAKYPGTDALKWQKKKGIGYVDFDGESYKAELHWYEEPTVGRVEFKIKPDADGNWFYEDE